MTPFSLTSRLSAVFSVSRQHLNSGLKFSANNEEEDNKTPWRRKSSSVKNINDIMKNVKVNMILILKVNVNVEYLVGVVSQ